MSDIRVVELVHDPLREDLRDAVREWFEWEHKPLPDAVTFYVTGDYDDGPAWDTYGATLHYGDRTEGADDFERTSVADALVEISEDERPFGTPRPVLHLRLKADTSTAA
ncbi:hypothetical protein G3I60_04990 [Streptomyces sp. SID13666]|uniref:hypothetical protein n=1 Tax=Streptomyces sp. SID13666 TaxID=2706054 RepID=UPI0013BEDF5A|nr:hypothetical protein [Streptomyces sp. SID13666]NEA53525.1 hypothetical protein [Streptomyces sp. SID13666]